MSGRWELDDALRVIFGLMAEGEIFGNRSRYMRARDAALDAGFTLRVTGNRAVTVRKAARKKRHQSMNAIVGGNTLAMMNGWFKEVYGASLDRMTEENEALSRSLRGRSNWESDKIFEAGARRASTREEEEAYFDDLAAFGLPADAVDRSDAVALAGAINAPATIAGRVLLVEELATSGFIPPGAARTVVIGRPLQAPIIIGPPVRSIGTRKKPRLDGRRRR